MITAIITGLFFVLFASLAESYEYRERYVVTDILEDKYLSKAWHFFQLFERIAAIAFGFSLCIMAKRATVHFLFITLVIPINSLLVVFFVAAVFWIVYDSAINIARNKNIFYISGQSANTFDVFAHPWLKILLLVTSIILLFL